MTFAEWSMYQEIGSNASRLISSQNFGVIIELHLQTPKFRQICRGLRSLKVKVKGSLRAQ